LSLRVTLHTSFQSQDEIDSREPDFKQLMESGPKWIQDESDLQQQSLKEQLDNLETGWNDVHILWANRKKMLIQALNHQVKKTANKQTLKTNVEGFFLFAIFADDTCNYKPSVSLFKGVQSWYFELFWPRTKLPFN